MDIEVGDKVGLQLGIGGAVSSVVVMVVQLLNDGRLYARYLHGSDYLDGMKKRGYGELLLFIDKDKIEMHEKAPK